MFDLIGDIHGHCTELAALLRGWGYREQAGAWRHPSRTAVFVGDFLDRGPEIREALRLVRSMIEGGSALAVMGNHELNALAFHHPDPDAPGEFLRRHSARNKQQHEATLAQVPAAELTSHLEFFRALPISLELGGFRVVHACWDEVALAVVEDGLARHGGIDDGFLIEGHNPESLLFAALEILLKGKEIDLPDGSTFLDKDGVERNAARVRWYASPLGQTVATYALPAQRDLPRAPLPAKVLAEARPYAASAPPVYFGHYWLDDPSPAALAPNVFCIDYSVARGGFLCGYRFEEPGRGTFAQIPARGTR
ncbi:MAG: metallophosphoesterase [Thermoanaerobaculia bacterium]